MGPAPITMKHLSPQLIVFAALAACSPLQGADVDFERDIQPILEKRCWNCHGEEEQESGLRLARRAAMLLGGDLGSPAIVPGNPEKSTLIEAVRQQRFQRRLGERRAKNTT